MTNVIATGAIQGPPFRCPECSASFEKRGGLGSHRFSIHHVSGTSTGSVAYKSGQIKAKRTYTKRTPIVYATPNVKLNKNGQPRGPYNKKPKVQSNPLLDMIQNPNGTVRDIDSTVAEKQIVIDNLKQQIAELNSQVATLERFRQMLTQATTERTFEHAVA